MAVSEDSNKILRILDIYTRLSKGQVVNKQELASQYNVHPRSIQRDMEDIRQFLDDQMVEGNLSYKLIYDRNEKGFRLENTDSDNGWLSNDEILAISKILLDSRAFPVKTMNRLLDKLVNNCVPVINRKLVSGLLNNERFHYTPPTHNKDVIGKMWALGRAINEHLMVDVLYHRLKGNEDKKRRIEPLAIMFSEMYFYLVAYIDDKEMKQKYDDKSFSPAIYRIDRIKELRITDQHFKIPYSSRFEEGEFRKRIQFMIGGKLRKIKFRYSGLSIESVLDRLPTAKILEEKDGVYTVQAEVFGDGIDMWLRSQGENIELI